MDKKNNIKRKAQREEEEDQWEDDSGDEQLEQIQRPQKINKSGKQKSVRFQEQEDDGDDLKKNVSKKNLEYEDEHFDEFDDEELIDEKEINQQQKLKPYLGTDKDLKEDEELIMDNRAYESYHKAEAEWPCLSFDFLLPNKEPYYLQNPGFQKLEKYPFNTYMVSGSQSGNNKNYIYLLSMSNLHKTKYDDDSDYQNSDDENDDEDAHMRVESIQITENVNRIRSMQHLPIIAFWQENGDVNIMDVKNKFFTMVEQEEEELKKTDSTPYHNRNNTLNNIQCNKKVFKNQSEGYGLDWSFLKQGYLLSGSCDGQVYLYQPRNENFSDIVRQKVPFTYHNGSVEDLQWSPKEANEFASCSTDGTIQICDIRTDVRNKSSQKILASETDVNVISWCRPNANLLCSGDDNGLIKVWDRRYPKNAYAEIEFHKEPITSIQFQPNDETTIAASSADNRLTIWDFAVENDDAPEDNIQEEEEEIPETMMFLHQGQKDMKELRYHPIYYELVGCTALDGFNLFKPCLDENESQINPDDQENEKNIPKIKEKDLEKLFGKMNLDPNIEEVDGEEEEGDDEEEEEQKDENQIQEDKQNSKKKKNKKNNKNEMEID